MLYRVPRMFVVQAIDDVLDGFDLQRAYALGHLILAEQRRGALDLADDAAGERLRAALQGAHASTNLGDRVPRGIVVGRMTQGVHDLIEHALAGLDAQIPLVVVGGGLRPQRGQPFLDEVLLPVQCVDLQLLETVRIHAADALLSRVMRLVYESMTISTARRFSG